LKTPEAPQAASLRWRKSSYSSAQNACVEVADTRTACTVRDSKNPGHGHLTFTAKAWRSFVAHVKDGKYDA
jgi:hypothetical protein